jgi:ATPase subunit of ABC transporter with duplicated ATPase domains
MAPTDRLLSATPLRITVVGATGAGKSALLSALAANVQRPLHASEAPSIRELVGAAAPDLVLECLDVRTAVGKRAQAGEGRCDYTGAFIRVYTKMDETDGTLLPDEDWDGVDLKDPETETWRLEHRYQVAFMVTSPVTGGADASFAVSARTKWRLDELTTYVQTL